MFLTRWSALTYNLVSFDLFVDGEKEGKDPEVQDLEATDAS